jgi:hypothetical protein
MMKRTSGGARSYDSSGNMSHGGGKGGKGGMKIAPGMTDTKKLGNGAVPDRSYGASGAHVKGTRLPGGGKPRHG